MEVGVSSLCSEALRWTQEVRGSQTLESILPLNALTRVWFCSVTGKTATHWAGLTDTDTLRYMHQSHRG